MQLSTLFLAIASATSLVTAKPIEKRTIGGITMCTGANFTGTCEYRVWPLETCITLGAPFYKNTNTFVPDEGNWFCYPYLMDCGAICRSPTGCTMGPIDSTRPDYRTDLQLQHWDKMIRSFDCHFYTNRTEYV
ncbi:hypothetical protein B0H63DRAFT_262752 [Podospora didyma]|uniref:Uncharacterized protein n=1 Tax=Podospora didyma TaxID=330526 RepID=A0AAE0NA22_9PEZI|nr:hypothetical protein B0H63DRAFT_262752 [Podospora didyma]